MSELLYLSFSKEPPDTEVVAATGEIDLSNCNRLAEAIDQLSADRVIVDLSRCTFFDSSCLGVLVTYANKAAREERSFGVRVDEQGRRLIQLTNLSELLGMQDAVSLPESVA